MEYDSELLPKLDKQYILDNVGQENIFQLYLGLPVDTTVDYRAPYRQDNTPGCRYYYKGGVLRFNDFAGYFHGDCFDYVGFVIGENAKTTDGFKAILEHIALTFRVHKYKSRNYVKDAILDIIIKTKSKPKVEIKKRIRYYKRNWNKYDAWYFKRFGFTKSFLEEHKVIPCETVYIEYIDTVNNSSKFKLFYNYDNKFDLAYCYDWGIDDRKVYFPLRNKPKFVGTTNILQGLFNYQPSEIGIITKSYKDVMAIRKVCRGYFDIDSIAPSNESYVMTKNQVSQFKHYNNLTLTLYDFDRTGRKTAFSLWRRDGVYPLFFTNSVKLLGAKSFNYRVKDFSEYLEVNGMDKTRKLIERIQQIFRKKWQI